MTVKITFKRKASPKIRQMAIDLIRWEFPEIWDDVDKYANDNSVDVGDIAAWTVAEVIYPYLVKNLIIPKME